MTLTSSLAIIVFAALIHASFQLSISVLTLMSGHAIGKKTAHTRLLKLIGGFNAGVGVMTMLLVASLSFTLQHLFGTELPLTVWAVTCGILVGVGVSVWRFYYRPGRGTSLWLPRNIALFLSERSKLTKRAPEAFGLGLSTVTGELLFIAAPIMVSSLVLIHLSPLWQLIGVTLYTLISILPLLIVSMLIGGGHKLSSIQKWRENNKNFLQFVAGSGMLILGVYVYVDQVVSATVMASGGGQ